MAKKRVFVPKLNNLIIPKSQKGKIDWRKKAKWMKDNLGNFYSQLSVELFGGNLNGHKRSYVSYYEGTPLTFNTLPGEFNVVKRALAPDIVDSNPSGDIFREVKCLSGRTSQPFCSITQTENMAYLILKSLEIGQKKPRADYLFYSYGNRETNRLFDLTKGELVTFLSAETKGLVVVPFPLALFLYSVSRSETKDQTSSVSPRDYETYWGPNRGILTLLRDSNEPIINLLERNFVNYGSKKISLEDCFIDKIKFRRYTSLPMRVSCYGKDRNLETFNISEFYLKDKDHIEWLNLFQRDHERILRGLALTDVYKLSREYDSSLKEKKMEDKNDLPF